VDEHTFSVGELTDAVQIALDVVFPDELWVQGEISSLNRSSSGHVYFDLIEPAAHGGPPKAQIAVTLFASAKASVNATLKRVGGVRMTDGVAIRLRGRLGVYGPRGRLQLRMSAIDPEHTLGRLAGERDRLLAELRAEGLLERNGALALPLRPRRVGLLTSAGSAAEADFLHELEASGLGWDVVAVDVRVQGAGADRAVAAGLRALAARGVDVVAVVRGGGARTDLATFDSEAVARTVANLGAPVLTGIGHETDVSVADQVAHTSCKTPTACAAHLVSRARAFDDRVCRVWAAIGTQAVRVLDDEARRMRALGTSTSRAALTGLATARHRVEERGRRLGLAAVGGVDRASLALDSVEARVRALDPRRALDRGWSITRTADGALLRDVAALHHGDELVTTVARGTVRSRVSASAPAPSDESDRPGAAP
jgi:exodeoxyribonuclease VII large subunit